MQKRNWRINKGMERMECKVDEGRKKRKKKYERK
jgi:hypothetical protein